MKAKKNGWFTLLKVLLVIIIIVVIILVAAYFVLKYVLGVDIFAIKKQTELLAKPITQAQVQDAPTAEDEANLVIKLKNAGLAGVMVNDKLDDLLNYYFSADYDDSAQINKDITLTSKDITIISNKLFTKLVEQMTEEERESATALGPEIIQINISNLRNGTASLFPEKLVDFEVVLKVNISAIKKTFNFFPASLITKKLPNELYLFLNMTASTTNVAFGYSHVDGEFSVNTLTIEQTKKLLNVFKFIDIGTMEELAVDLDSMVVSLIFGLTADGGGVAAEPGVVSFFNALGASGYEFVVDGTNVSIKIKQ